MLKMKITTFFLEVITEEDLVVYWELVLAHHSPISPSLMGSSRKLMAFPSELISILKGTLLRTIPRSVFEELISKKLKVPELLKWMTKVYKGKEVIYIVTKEI